MSSIKVAIVGSRDFDHDIKMLSSNSHTLGMNVMIRDLVRAMKKTDIVVSGGATGADHHAERWATLMKRSRTIHEADWDTYHKAAGPIRNALIVRDADILFAFYTDRTTSRGTLNCVSQARKKGIPVYEFDAKTNQWYSEGETMYVVVEAIYRDILRRVIESSGRPGVEGENR